MLRARVVWAIAATLLLCPFTVSEAADCQFHGKALSLQVLEQQLSRAPELAQRPELQELGGITRVLGFVVDPTGRDIILAGERESGPPVKLDDLVVALRSAWILYGRQVGNTFYYSEPGCSIDPDPRVFEELDKIGRQFNSQTEDAAIQQVIDDWCRICSSPQQVRVLGVPPNSHFADVMVTADYDMKRVVDGSDSLDIRGFRSLIDRMLDRIESDLDAERATSVPLSSMNRFWFYPGEGDYLGAEDVLLIESCPVVLLTEQEHLSREGDFQGSGSTDPYAQSFCSDFSKWYATIAARRPIYRELEELYRLVATAKLLKSEIDSRSELPNLDHLLNHYIPADHPVPATLPGRCGVKSLHRARAEPGGYSETSVWLPSCGGVNMSVAPRRREEAELEEAQRQRLQHLRQAVLDSRPGPNALAWNWFYMVKCGIPDIDEPVSVGSLLFDSLPPRRIFSRAEVDFGL